MPDVIDFIVLKQAYDTAMRRNWKAGNRNNWVRCTDIWMILLPCDVFYSYMYVSNLHNPEMFENLSNLTELNSVSFCTCRCFHAFKSSLTQVENLLYNNL